MIITSFLYFKIQRQTGRKVKTQAFPKKNKYVEKIKIKTNTVKKKFFLQKNTLKKRFFDTIGATFIYHEENACLSYFNRFQMYVVQCAIYFLIKVI